MSESAEQEDALFVNLVLMFQSAAMQQMGKVTNPMTGKVEKNLDQARFSIDMIEMLKAKTSGNLSVELEKLVDSTLTNLRLNYVDEAGKSEKEGPETGEPEGQDKSGTDAAGKEPVSKQPETSEGYKGADAGSDGEPSPSEDAGAAETGGDTGSGDETSDGGDKESGAERQDEGKKTS